MTNEERIRSWFCHRLDIVLPSPALYITAEKYARMSAKDNFQYLNHLLRASVFRVRNTKQTEEVK